MVEPQFLPHTVRPDAFDAVLSRCPGNTLTRKSLRLETVPHCTVATT
jgi:hypothetical protein